MTDTTPVTVTMHPSWLNGLIDLVNEIIEANPDGITDDVEHGYVALVAAKMAHLGPVDDEPTGIRWCLIRALYDDLNDSLTSGQRIRGGADLHHFVVHQTPFEDMSTADLLQCCRDAGMDTISSIVMHRRFYDATVRWMFVDRS
jgi:hypothetical protein